MRSVLSCVTWVALSAHGAGVTESEAAERARIRSERAAAEARFSERERECKTKFVVTSCVNEARQARRDTLGRLRGEEAVLEDVVRKRKAAERLRELDENRDREQTRQREVAAPERRDAVREAGAPRVTVRPPKVLSPDAASAATTERRIDEARNKAAFEARQQEAQAHRAKIEERHVERTAKGRLATPLPASAASAP